MTTETQTIEKKRKIIHLGSLVFPILYYFSSFHIFLLLYIAIFAVWLFIDYQRSRKPAINELIIKAFGQIFREDESKGFSGATFLMIGSLITIIFFEKETAIIALSILAISDSLAALVGMKYGEIKIGSKSLEGAAAFFISGLLVISLVNWCFGIKALYFYETMFALAITTFAELKSKDIGINDNILIPVCFAIFTALFETIL